MKRLFLLLPAALASCGRQGPTVIINTPPAPEATYYDFGTSAHSVYVMFVEKDGRKFAIASSQVGCSITQITP